MPQTSGRERRRGGRWLVLVFCCASGALGTLGMLGCCKDGPLAADAGVSSDRPTARDLGAGDRAPASDEARALDRGRYADLAPAREVARDGDSPPPPPPFAEDPDLTLGQPGYATGSAVVDLDGDGWPDWLMSGGNDMVEQPLVVYRNDGRGGFGPSPQWTSSELAFHGHLAVADVDGDGALDVVVTVIGPADQGGTATSPPARLYLGDGKGGFAGSPAWMPAEHGRAFGCALGDLDGDGRLDLALAGGWAYDPAQCPPTAVFLSRDATATAPWPARPSWTAPGRCDGDVAFADLDGDRRLDLAAAGFDNAVYHGSPGGLGPLPAWVSTDGSVQDGNRLLAVDLDGDGVLDLLVSDNDQLSHPTATGFKLYRGPLGPGRPTQPVWSYVEHYASALAAGDVDADGSIEVATGCWWGPLRLFASDQKQGLAGLPLWSSRAHPVAEAMVLADVDRDGILDLLATNWEGGGQIYYGRSRR